MKRCFISFDYDHDKFLKDFIVGQSKNPGSPFSIEDWSIKDPSYDWKEKARYRIRSSDIVIIICGKETNTASGVSEELIIAQEENIPYFLLAGYSELNCLRPIAAKNTDKIYKWTWDNLKKLIDGSR